MGKEMWGVLIGTKPLLLRQVRQVQQISGFKARQQGWDTGETGGTGGTRARGVFTDSKRLQGTTVSPFAAHIPNLNRCLIKKLAAV